MRLLLTAGLLASLVVWDAEAKTRTLAGLGSPEERVMVYSANSFTPPGLKYMDAHVAFPLQKMLRQTSHQFLRSAGPEFQCTSADGPFCSAQASRVTSLDTLYTGVTKRGGSSEDSDGRTVHAQTNKEFHDIISQNHAIVVFGKSNCPKCHIAETEVSLAVLELDLLGQHFLAIRVECDASEETSVICSGLSVDLSLLPDIRIYFGSVDSSVKWIVEEVGLTSTNYGEGDATELSAESSDTLSWRASSLVTFISNPEMQRIFSLMSQMSKGMADMEGELTVLLKDEAWLDEVLADSEVEEAEEGGGLFGSFPGLESLIKRATHRVEASAARGGRRNIEFRNDSEMTVAVLWKDAQDGETEYAKLLPGGRKVISSFIGHEWLLRDKVTGEIAHEVTVLPGEGTQVMVLLE
eukprot:CAMPEP_0196582446 /NCGR_PEP_ID=MMETSP1081-20130531/38910_1 /TAXON_ID=36882 /ORGANISM="Pyramimonas amylifera, Strain CCMP720" /LENGTH=408 /DNA_ID=CAMNT_0041903001 /DNA_START=213 /DNA_END=1439 /DNA_ORIENTATION=+